MNNQEEPDQLELIERYRTTLITLARHYVAMVEKAARIRSEAGSETVGGRKAGLYCNASVIRKNSARLKEILDQDRGILWFFFRTTNLQNIAKETIRIEQ